jgi:hypothetical protein
MTGLLVSQAEPIATTAFTSGLETFTGRVWGAGIHRRSGDTGRVDSGRHAVNGGQGRGGSGLSIKSNRCSPLLTEQLNFTI